MRWAGTVVSVSGTDWHADDEYDQNDDDDDDDDDKVEYYDEADSSHDNVQLHQQSW